MMQGFKVLMYDDDQIYKDKNAAAEVKAKELEDYKKDGKNYSTVPFKLKKDPSNGWATPFITGHKYKIHFGKTGLDWDQAQFQLSDRWVPEDKSIYFVHNFTDQRATIDSYVAGKMLNEYKGEGEEKKTTNVIAAAEADQKLGQSILFPEDEVREFHFVANAKGTKRGPANPNLKL